MLQVDVTLHLQRYEVFYPLSLFSGIKEGDWVFDCNGKTRTIHFVLEHLDKDMRHWGPPVMVFSETKPTPREILRIDNTSSLKNPDEYIPEQRGLGVLC